MLDKEQLDAIEARAKAVTPAPAALLALVAALRESWTDARVCKARIARMLAEVRAARVATREVFDNPELLTVVDAIVATVEREAAR